MKNILVTGSNGQLGTHFKLISTVNRDFNFLFTDLPELDITNEGQVETFLSKHKPDWIINCAAYTAVDKAESDADKANLLNADAPALLARLSEKHQARLIHVSTDYVFDGKAHSPYKENANKNPQGVYAQSKSLGEDLVLVTNPRSIIVRTSWLYSAFGNNFMKTIIKVGQEKGSLRVVADQTGTPTWAGDLAEAVMKLITMDVTPGIYHFSNEGVCSWYDFAKAIIMLNGINCEIQPVTTDEYPVQAVRPCYSVLDKSLYKATTGASIPWWFESLKKCIVQYNSL